MQMQATLGAGGVRNAGMQGGGVRAVHGCRGGGRKQRWGMQWGPQAAQGAGGGARSTRVRGGRNRRWVQGGSRGAGMLVMWRGDASSVVVVGGEGASSAARRHVQDTGTGTGRSKPKKCLVPSILPSHTDRDH